MKVVLPDAGMPGENRSQWSYEMLNSGRCDAILDINVNLKPESLGETGIKNACSNLYLNPYVEFIDNYNVGMFRAQDAALFHNVSQAMIAVNTSPAYARILQDTIGFGLSCDKILEQRRQNLDVDPAITVEQMRGTFIIFAGCCLLALAATAAQTIYNKSKGLPLGESKEEVQNEKLDAKLDRVLVALDALRSLPADSGGARLVVEGASLQEAPAIGHA